MIISPEEAHVDPTLTKGEFESGYARRSGMTLDELRDQGFYTEPCDCEYENCKGWKVMFKLVDTN